MKTFVKIILFGFLIISINSKAQRNSFILGQASFDKKDYPQAISYLNSFLNENRNYPKAIILRSKAYLMSGKFTEALDDLSKVKMNPDLLLIQARAYAGAGDKIAAFEKLAQYLATNHKIAAEIIKVYPEFNNLKQSKEWEDLWLNIRYTEKEITMNDITYAIKSERFAEAADRLDIYLMKYKSNAEAYFLRGNIYFANKEFDQALSYYENAIALDNKVDDYIISKAMALHQLKKDKKALEECNQLLTKDSLIISAWLLRAEINFELANDEDASTELSKYLQYYPDNTIAQYLNAQINARRGDLLNAIAEFGRLIKLNPANPDYFIGRADAYFKTKTYTYAIKDYAMALDLYPKNIEVYKMKAKAHQLAGDLKGACINWQHAVRLGDIESRGFLQKYCKNLH